MRNLLLVFGGIRNARLPCGSMLPRRGCALGENAPVFRTLCTSEESTAITNESERAARTREQVENSSIAAIPIDSSSTS
jgi:hypothetical protein